MMMMPVIAQSELIKDARVMSLPISFKIILTWELSSRGTVYIHLSHTWEKYVVNRERVREG